MVSIMSVKEVFKDNSQLLKAKQEKEKLFKEINSENCI